MAIVAYHSLFFHCARQTYHVVPEEVTWKHTAAHAFADVFHVWPQGIHTALHSFADTPKKEQPWIDLCHPRKLTRKSWVNMNDHGVLIASKKAAIETDHGQIKDRDCVVARDVDRVWSKTKWAGVSIVNHETGREALYGISGIQDKLQLQENDAWMNITTIDSNNLECRISSNVLDGDDQCNMNNDHDKEKFEAYGHSSIQREDHLQSEHLYRDATYGTDDVLPEYQLCSSTCNGGIAMLNMHNGSVLVEHDKAQIEGTDVDFISQDEQKLQAGDTPRDASCSEPNFEYQFHITTSWDAVTIQEILQFMPELWTQDDLLDKRTSLLQLCRCRRNEVVAKLVHVHICAYGLDTHKMLGSYLIGMFVASGGLADAQHIFEKLVARNTYAWTYIIQGHIHAWKLQKALTLYSQMKFSGLDPDAHTLLVLVNACMRLKSAERGREVHHEIVINGFEDNLYIGRALIDFYVNCGLLADAIEVYQDLPVKDLFSWTALKAGYDAHCLHDSWFENMQPEDIPMDSFLIIYALKACGRRKDLEQGWQTHNEIIFKGFNEKSYVGNALVYMYIKCASVSEARWVLHKHPTRDVVSWTSLITGLADLGLGDEALKCWDDMQQDGVFPNAFTLVSMMKACRSIKAVEVGYSLHIDIVQKGLDSEIIICNGLLDMYGKFGMLAEAQYVFAETPSRDTITWTSLIDCCVEYGCPEKAIDYMHQMEAQGISPNLATYVCSLKACGLALLLDKGYQVHADSVVRGYEINDFVGNALMDMYAKCCSFTDAETVLYQLSVVDVVTWTAMISGYVKHHFYKEALDCFDEMQQEGVSPNAVTYVCILRACASLGAANIVHMLHGEIVSKGFDKDFSIESTLVDTYAECGKLYDTKHSTE